MRNPARELHVALSQWRDSGQTSYYTRRVALDGADALQSHKTLMDDFGLLQAVVSERGGEPFALKKVQRHYIDIVAAIIASTTGVLDNGTLEEVNIDIRMLDALEQAAEVIEGFVATEQAKAQSLDGLFAEIKRLAADDQAMSGELKAFVVELMSSIQRNLLQGSLGHGFDLKREMDMLWVSLLAIQNAAPDETRGRWSHLAAVTKRAAVGVVAHGPGWLALGGTYGPGIMGQILS